MAAMRSADQSGRLRAWFLRLLLRCFLRFPPPARVGQTNGFVVGSQKYKGTQSGERGESLPGSLVIRTVDVVKGTRCQDAASAIFFSYTAHVCRMGLIRSNDAFYRKSDRFADSPVVFQYIFRVVASGKLRFMLPRYPSLTPPQTGAETMDNGGFLFQSRVGKIRYTVVLSDLHVSCMLLFPMNIHNLLSCCTVLFSDTVCLFSVFHLF